MKPVLAKIDDLNGLVELEEACFTSDRISRRQYRHLINSASACVVIVKEGARVIGSAVYLFRRGSDKARLYSLSVDPCYRHLGLAVALCAFGDRRCAETGCSEVRLEVKCDNARAIRFHEKNGYVQFGKYTAYYADGLDAIRMRKFLA